MSLDMVANRQGMSHISVSYLEKLLVKLKMSKEKSYVVNIPEWEEALKTTFETGTLSGFLSKFSGIEAPPEEVARLQIERDMAVVLKSHSNVSESIRIKIESQEEKDDSSSVSGGQSKDRSPDKGDRHEKFKELLRKNAQEMAQEKLDEHRQAEARGVKT